VTSFADDPCARCEEVLQPYLDRELSEAYCRKRYRFEAHLRRFVRQAVVAEPMPPELKARLAQLRTPLL